MSNEEVDLHLATGPGIDLLEVDGPGVDSFIEAILGIPWFGTEEAKGGHAPVADGVGEACPRLE